MAAIEAPESSPDSLLPVIDLTVKSGPSGLADTLGWAWLAVLKESKPPAEALGVGRELLVHLTDGDQLRDEILSLYQSTHQDRSDLQAWIDRSGLKSGKSVRRALRYLDVGLQLAVGVYLLHRTDDQAAQIVEFNLESDEAVIKIARRTATLPLDKLIEDYDVVEETDFRVLQQLNPDRLADLAENDPAALALGIVQAHGRKITRDAMKLILSPKHVPAEKWSDWWNRLKTAIKRVPNLRIEGRSPVFLIFDEVAKSLEQTTWDSFAKAKSPREWLELLETYLRDSRALKQPPDPAFLNKVQHWLVERIGRFLKHQEPTYAFTTALVIERVAADGLPVSTDAHGMAVKMLSEAKEPVAMVAAVPDARLWSLAVTCLEQAYEADWPRYFSELILCAPSAQCDVLAKKIEKAGRGELLPPIVQRALADPGRYTDAVMWVWRKPDLETSIARPPDVELFSLIMGLVGPARDSEGRASGQTMLDMRAKVRAGFSARDYAVFRDMVLNLDESMAQAVRRLIERGDGLGPTVQDEMMRILRGRFAVMFAKPKVALWDDESILVYTPRGLKSKEDELAELVNVKMRENAKAIGEAAAHGDLSENSEYKFALEERDFLRARVAKLNREISMARVLEQADIPVDFIAIGQRITLQPTVGGSPVEITILGYDESDLAHHVYSYHSPFARLLIGKRVGEVVQLSIDDHITEYRIVSFAPANA